jgi:hypothetical protein
MTSFLLGTQTPATKEIPECLEFLFFFFCFFRPIAEMLVGKEEDNDTLFGTFENPSLDSEASNSVEPGAGMKIVVAVTSSVKVSTDIHNLILDGTATT